MTSEEAEKSLKKQGYASYKRSELFKILKPVLGKLINICVSAHAYKYTKKCSTSYSKF